MPGYGNINKFLAAKSYGAMLSIVERDARAREQMEQKTPRTVGDLMLVEILKRLHVMRDIAARATRLPLSNEERRTCQRELEGLKTEIDSLAASIPATPSPEDAMQTIDSSIARVSELVDEWAERAGPQPTEQREQTITHNDTSEEAKITRWMESLMKDWGQEPDDDA